MESATITREFDNGRQVSTTIRGQVGIDDIVDIFRGFLVQIGYHPSVASRLTLSESDEADECAMKTPPAVRD